MPRRKTTGASPGKRAQSVAAREDLLLRGVGLGPRRKACDSNDAERKDGSQSEPNLRYLHKKFKKMAEAVGAEGGGAAEGNGGGADAGRAGAVAAVAVEAASADTSPVEASPPPPASPPSSSNDASSSSSSEESKRKGSASGRHVCPYCKLACAKPSVLQKHVRAHTNERPFPCRPCGLAFKTKSNLYKHCRSRSHALKAEQPSSTVPEGGAGEEEEPESLPNCLSEEEEEEGGDGNAEGRPPSPRFENPETRSPRMDGDAIAATVARPRPIYKPKFHTAALYREEEQQQQRHSPAEGGTGGPSVLTSSELREETSQSTPVATPCPEYLRRHVARIIDENRAIVEGERTAWTKKRLLGQRVPASNRVVRSDSPPRVLTDGLTPGESRLAHALLRPPSEQPLNLSRGGNSEASRWEARNFREEDSSPVSTPPCRGLEVASPRPREMLRGEATPMLRACPLCRAQFRDEESLETHRMCYCEVSRGPTYVRKVTTDSEDCLVGACLPSPGPLLGNTPLVDGYGPPTLVPASKAGPPPKKRRTEAIIPPLRTLRPGNQEPPPSMLRTVEDHQMPESPSVLSARPANAVHLFGGEVRIREGSETKTLRIDMGGRGGGGTGGEVLRREEGGGSAIDGETVVTIARSGLHSGGTIVHVRKSSSCEDEGSSGVSARRQKGRGGGRRSLAPSPTGESSPPSSLSLPIAPQITTPDLAPDLRASFGPFPSGPTSMDGRILSYDTVTLAPPSFRAASVSVPLRPSPPPPPSPSLNRSACSGVLTIFHGGRAVPFVPGMPGPQGSPHLPPLLAVPARSPRPLDLASDHGSSDVRSVGGPMEPKDAHPNNVVTQSASPNPPPLPPPNAPATTTSVIGGAGRESDAAADGQNKRSRFLRPTSLPLKPGTYPLKKHSQGNTPLGIGSSSGASLVSPETPRPRKSYGQLYLNGHAYTYLGLKCSTRPSFCCAHRRPPQPMYVAQGPAHPRLSMYSNWKVCEAVTAEPFGLEPGKAMRLYDSRHRPPGTTVAPSQPSPDSQGPNSMILTHSSYWLLKKEREGNGEKQEIVVPKEEELSADDKMEKVAENGKPILNPPENEKLKDNEPQCPKTSGSEGEAQSQPPARVKIFAGGFESNEEYIYVRGRGRGRYVCEECGIRCKKPSMLKKHIRTHTDVRPFTCRHCCFSFKTKGNLTKHMKSKAHFKKCVEMGIVPVPTTVDESHIDEESLAKQQALRAACNEGESESDDDEEEDEEEEDEEEEEEEEESADGGDSSKGKMEQEEREVACSLLSLSESVDPTNGVGRMSTTVEPSLSYPTHSGLTPIQSRPRSYPYLSHLQDNPDSPPHPVDIKAGDEHVDADPGVDEGRVFPVTCSSSTLVAVASGQRYYFPSRRDALRERTMDESLSNSTSATTSIVRESNRGESSPPGEVTSFVSGDRESLSQESNDISDGINGSNCGPVDLSRGSMGSHPSTPEERGTRGGWRARGLEREEPVRLNSRTMAQQSFVIPTALPHSPYSTAPAGTPTTPVREHPSEILAPVPSDSAALLASLCSTVDKLPPSTLDVSSGDGSVVTTPTVDDGSASSGTMLQAYLTERALQDVRLKRQQRSPFHPSVREDQVDGVPIVSTGACNVITSAGTCSVSLHASSLSKGKSVCPPHIVHSPSYDKCQTPHGKTLDVIQDLHMQAKACERIPSKDWHENERENGETNIYNMSSSAPISRMLERSVVVQSEISSVPTNLKCTDSQVVGDSHGQITTVASSEVMKSGHAAGPRLVSCSPKAEFMPPHGGPSSSYAGVTEDGRSMCAICHKVFNKASQLRLHVNIHYFERPFRCDSCAVSFRTRGHLQKHQRSVSHQNKVSMNSTFGMPTTENPRPFKCGDCKIAFRIHGHLAKHLRSKMHIMRLECVGKLPFGTYAEVERSGISLADIDTSDCENSLESLQILAQKLYEKDPSKLQHWERTRALSESSEDEAIAYHRDESGHGIPVPNGPLHGGALMRPSVLEQTSSRTAYCGTLASDYEDASDGETHLMLQPQLTRSFICDFCDAGFTSKLLLQNHLLVHQQSSPDNCL